MNCTEFHEQLPYQMESGGSPEAEAHLKSCPNCADLVKDLRYIAEQAKLLLPLRDPSPQVWNNIARSLEAEGLTSPSRLPLGAIERTTKPHQAWGSMTWAVAAAAVVLVAVGLFIWRGGEQPSSNLAANSGQPVQAEELPQDDQQLLLQVSQREPALRPVYERNLRNVNAYIAQVKQAVERDPADNEVRQHLMQAYAQKAMLYEMAVSRSLQ
jgi:hypothetical protein